jgi:hypothetical protein
MLTDPTIKGKLMKKENIFFTVIDTKTGDEHRACFSVNVDGATEFEDDVSFYDSHYKPHYVLKGGPTICQFPVAGITVAPQQMAELGHLLIALSGHEYEKDSVEELLDGYGIGLVSILKRFVKFIHRQLQKGSEL